MYKHQSVDVCTLYVHPSSSPMVEEGMVRYGVLKN